MVVTVGAEVEVMGEEVVVQRDTIARDPWFANVAGGVCNIL